MRLRRQRLLGRASVREREGGGRFEKHSSGSERQKRSYGRFVVCVLPLLILAVTRFGLGCLVSKTRRSRVLCPSSRMPPAALSCSCLLRNVFCLLQLHCRHRISQPRHHNRCCYSPTVHMLLAACSPPSVHASASGSAKAHTRSEAPQSRGGSGDDARQRGGRLVMWVCARA
ncbi:uncharacterized protein K452DRAFT_111649 [Aplosporella prunicola CBS 121167]|uniref:Uncharacterized protein n=1 Tax=Aplosporella prunicola CBS 121167 TaxID=1176127 RepID=A0A6A6B0C0_9PEZI|nr:uncharacterized protein K452DRAFT_111649 [Aplosporella prunicola CBS 121167]KAF2137326.1 hypothetical protein K452DRAFT_111649 [Aplosporella prunicola CBS 121167]